MQMTFTKLPKSITAEELLSTPLPPVKWIVPGLLPAGLALFAGPSKAGKSWLTLWLCLQIAQGNPVWNREIEPRTVIYFSLEDTFNRLQNRIFQLIDGGDAPERLILQTECPSIGQGLEEQVESLIHTYRDVGLIVIDKPVFTSEEVRHARSAVNQLRNKKIQQGQYTDATDDMLLKLADVPTFRRM